MTPEQKDHPIEAQLEFWVTLLQSRAAALKQLRLQGFECDSIDRSRTKERISSHLRLIVRKRAACIARGLSLRGVDTTVAFAKDNSRVTCQLRPKKQVSRTTDAHAASRTLTARPRSVRARHPGSA